MGFMILTCVLTVQIVESLSSSYLGPDYSQVICSCLSFLYWNYTIQVDADRILNFLQPKELTDVSLKDIDQVARSSFPLCMRYLFEKVRNIHMFLWHLNIL